jgi:hypothetical protein
MPIPYYLRLAAWRDSRTGGALAFHRGKAARAATREQGSWEKEALIVGGLIDDLMTRDKK